MLNEERRKKLAELITRKKRILVGEVAENFGLSEVTIRKDLKILERRGLLTRVHGGAILDRSTIVDLALDEKEHLHPRDKERIAKRAEEMIYPGDVIILDSGSTTTRLARRLKDKRDITVITNAINIASELAAAKVELILTGGILREKSFSLVGPLAEDALRTVTSDKLFLGVDGIDFDIGLTTPNIHEAKVNQLMINSAREVILLADHSKFGRRSLGVIADIRAVSTLITDNKISEKDYTKLKQLGITVYAV
jgi:DeoR family transcriptional regulator of aga operon